MTSSTDKVIRCSPVFYEFYFVFGQFVLDFYLLTVFSTSTVS